MSMKSTSAGKMTIHTYVLSGTSGKAHHACMADSSWRTRKRHCFQCIGLAEKFGHRRIHSGGSDSSTGSTTPMNSDLDSADEETFVEKVRTSLEKKNQIYPLEFLSRIASSYSLESK